MYGMPHERRPDHSRYGWGAGLHHVWLLALKDLRSEFRRPYEVISLLTFSLGAVLIAGLTLGGGRVPPEMVASFIWILLLFLTTLTYTTSFARESDRGTLGGLKSLPCSPLAILGGKVVYGTLLILLVGSVMLFFTGLFLPLDLGGKYAEFFLIYALGAIGLSLAAAFVSGLVMFSEGSTLLLSFLLIPVSVPILLPAVRATTGLLSGTTEVLPALQLLLAAMGLILAVTLLTFTCVLQE
jgi:heme exporter protein B